MLSELPRGHGGTRTDGASPDGLGSGHVGLLEDTALVAAVSQIV